MTEQSIKQCITLGNPDKPKKRIEDYKTDMEATLRRRAIEDRQERKKSDWFGRT